jgi:carbamoyl-phosphate synthase small subunit
VSDSRPTARLALENGAVFEGLAFGACATPRTSLGEVVFNTAMSGYQEALTDPSYAGQILTMTAPLIGNYGVARDDVESVQPQVAGFVVRELARRYSNYRAVTDLSSWLAEAGVLGIERIDTRALVRLVRIEGAMRGALSCDPSIDDRGLVEMARSAPAMTGLDLACRVSPREAYTWREEPSEQPDQWLGPVPGPAGRELRVLALDCGAKRNIYRHLAHRGCRVQVVPHDATPEQIRALRPDGILVSNGPGDPAAVAVAIRTLRALLHELPIFGICLGHQLLALALGAQTFKLKFGHRGANQPVRNLLTGSVEITSQNHGFCVDPASLEAAGCEVTHVHLNDGTLAGFRHRTLPIMSVQYHPEASPGPHDSSYLFECFLRMMQTRRPITAQHMLEAQRTAREAMPSSSFLPSPAPNR